MMVKGFRDLENIKNEDQSSRKIVKTHLYLYGFGKFSPHVKVSHGSMDLGTGTCLCGIGHMAMCPIAKIHPRVPKVLLCGLNNTPLYVTNIQLCTFGKIEK